jgi:hypothetical protein
VSDERVNRILSRSIQGLRHLRRRFCESSVAKKSCKTQTCHILSGEVHFVIFLNDQHKVLSVKQLLFDEERPKEGFSSLKYA